MRHLVVLGSLSLSRADDGTPSSLLAQPKRLALLIYLVMARPRGPHQRDTILALFWPEFDAARARNALSQTLHHLRRTLPPGAIQNRGNELLEVDPALVDCDAWRFEALVQERRWSEALACYRGDLLPGFRVPGAPGFEQWLAEVREQLRQEARGAALSLAGERDSQGDLAGAVGALERALALAPEDEQTLRRLMSTQERLGDRAGARRSYEVFSRRLKDEFGLQPDAETQALVESSDLRQAEQEAASTTGRISAPPPPGTLPAASTRPRGTWRSPLLLALVLLMVAVPVLWLTRWRRTSLDPGLVVVVPFHLAGGDTTLDYLREGMVDLVAARLSGGVLSAVDPRAVLTAWQQLQGGRRPDAVSAEEARQLARGFGAGRLLMGAILGPADRPTISGRLLAVEDGASQATATVTGAVDSLPDLVDRLTSEVLAGVSTEPPERLADLMSASLPALESYLVGRNVFRQGDYAGAAASFRRAVQIDSTFALAWLQLADAGDWVGDPMTGEARQRAWQLRARLIPSDRAYLEALVGPSWPAESGLDERLAAWERVVALTPGRVEGWYGLGDILFHHGQFLEADSGFRRTSQAFGRAVALDSGYAAPLSHLVEIAALRGDAAETRRLLGLYRQLDSTGDVAEYLTWRVAQVTGDTSALRQARERLPKYSTPALRRIVTWSQLEGVGVDDGMHALPLVLARSATPAERDNALDVSLWPLGNAGRLEEVIAAMASRVPGDTPYRRSFRRAGVAFEYSSDFRLVDSLIGLNTARREPSDEAEINQVLALSRLVAGATVAPELLTRALDGMRRRRSDDPVSLAAKALLLAACCPAEARRVVDSASARLPALGASGSPPSVTIYLALAQFALGDTVQALRTIRRRSLDHWLGLPRLAQSLLIEGRIAAAVGDTVGAMKAYRHYLALRPSPDPALRPEVETVHRALAELSRRTVATR